MEENLEAAVEALRSHPDYEASPDGRALLDGLAGSPKPGLHHPPAAARRLMTALGRPDVGFFKLIELTKKDPALVKNVLRHANSAFYGVRTGHPIVTVKAAVQRIGTAGLHSVVSVEMARGLICRPGAEWDEAVEEVWSHMISTGEVARDIGRCFGADPEVSYTAGILHDVGKMVVFAGMAEQRKRSRRDPRLSTRFVAAVLAHLHGYLGGIAALEWGLGDIVGRAIACHHRNPPPCPDSKLSRVVYLAERLDHAERSGREVDLDELFRTGGLPGEPPAELTLAMRRRAEAETG